MAVLSDQDRDKVSAHFMRYVPTPTMLKADIRAATNAIDTWIDQNQAAFNAILPLPFKNVATLQQKTELFSYVSSRRAGLLKVEGE